MSVTSLLARINALKYDEINVDTETLIACGLRGITLRDYQLYGVGWIVGRFKAGHGCILADEMGLGKTCTSISSLLYLKEYSGLQMCLIICPLTIISNWTDEFERFAPGLTKIIITGSQSDRSDAIQSVRRDRPNVVLTTYEIFLIEQEKLLNCTFDVCILDEAHRVKNQATIGHKAIASIQCPFKLLLTGTPVQNNMAELYALLQMIAPAVFTSDDLSDFVSRFSTLGDEDSDLLSRVLVNFLLRRTKAQVLPDLPSKAEAIIYHGLSAVQKRLYRAILTKNADSVIGEKSVQVGNLMNILMQLRKCILHPYFFPGIEPEPFENGEHLVFNSGKMVVLDGLLRMLVDGGHKALIFSKFTSMLDIVQDYMSMRHFTYERLDGNIRGEERHAAINAFNQDESTKFFLLSTLAGGVGLNLTSADTVIFLDIDFNPQNDLQALARCHRIGQLRNVKVFRLICKGTVEQVMLRRQQNKLRLASHVLQNNSLSGLAAPAPLNSDELRKMIGFGAERLFVDTDEDDKIDVDQLISRIKVGKDGQWPDEDPDNVESDASEDEQLDIYDFEGSTYRQSPGTKKSLRQILGNDDATSTAQPGKRLRSATVPFDPSSGSVARPSPKRAPMPSKIPSDDEEEYVTDIQYIRGDVASALTITSHRGAISVLCVDSSGSWPHNSRLFDSFLKSCPDLSKEYAKAASEGKLKLGVTYLVDANDKNQAALLVCTLKGGRNLIRSSAFNQCIASLADQLKKKTIDYDVHFPRIGFGAKDLNWYGLERVIKKYLCKLKNVQVYVHYLPRAPTANKRLKLHFGDIFVGRKLRILDDDDNSRRLAIAYGAESAELQTTSTDAIGQGNGGIDDPQTVTKKWLLDSIRQGRALPLNNTQ